MSLTELLVIAVGLAMDAFAVSVCKGLSMKKINWGQAFTVALFFGGFQALMPVLGWLLGKGFAEMISDYDHWVSAALLIFIGVRMITESFKDEEEPDCGCGGKLDLKELLMLAVATSIDALAVGVTFAFLSVSILLSASVIGIITFALSLAGVAAGSRFGSAYKKIAEPLGGIALVLMGIKIPLSHLGIINF